MRRILFLLVTQFLYISLIAQKYPDSEKDGKFYEVNGSKIWTLSFGKGEPLFFIAGGPGGTHRGLRNFDELSKEYNLVYFDGIGRGKSDTLASASEYSLERDIEDLEGLRKAMGFDKINVLGHSYGGVVAQGYAIKYSNNLSKLMLMGSFHSYLMWQENCDNANHEIRTNYPEVWEELMNVREKGVVSSDTLHQQIYSRVSYSFLYNYNPETFRNLTHKPYPNPFNAALYYHMVGRDGDFELTGDIGTFDHRKGLKTLKMPVLIISGRYDRVAVPRMMVKYKTYCPQAKYVVFERSGHNPHVEQLDELLQLIRGFLAAG